MNCCTCDTLLCVKWYYYVDPAHGEALNNIAVLEMRRQKFDLARSCLTSSSDVGPFLFEPLFNAALMSYRMGDFQEAYVLVQKALTIYPVHCDSKELQALLLSMFTQV